MRSFLFILASFLVSMAGAQTPAEGSRIEFLDTVEKVTANYCLTEPPGLYKECSASHNVVVAVYPPPAFGQLIADQVKKAFDAGYAKDVSVEDLFHGHLITKGPKTDFDSADEIYADVQAIVYHSAEHQERWGNERRAGIPAAQRIPRSFVGFPWGLLQKAIDLVTPGTLLKSYESAGTIYTEELVNSHPEWVSSKDGWTSFGGTPPANLKVCRPTGECLTCRFELVANFGKVPNGRFLTPTGERMEVFSRCMTDQHL